MTFVVIFGPWLNLGKQHYMKFLEYNIRQSAEVLCLKKHLNFQPHNDMIYSQKYQDCGLAMAESKP